GAVTCFAYSPDSRLLVSRRPADQRSSSRSWRRARKSPGSCGREPSLRGAFSSPRWFFVFDSGPFGPLVGHFTKLMQSGCYCREPKNPRHKAEGVKRRAAAKVLATNRIIRGPRPGLTTS